MIAVNERQAKMVDAQKLIDYINETGNLGVDATSISMHFGIWRNDAVVLLDSLIAEGRLTKKGSKPILYFLPSTYSVSANSLSTEARNNGIQKRTRSLFQI